jgi:alpha-1,6-mannosyltransferase
MFRIDAVDIQLILVVLFYVICCPYSKVEESFNMQAVFDLTTFGSDTSSYDHLEFPGVVPRTFIGSLVIAALYLPLKLIISALALSGLYNQIAMRCVLGTVLWLSFTHFRNGVTVKFGVRASQLTGVLTAFQFHICFYMSRTLPNVFALAICLNAFAYWLKVSYMHARAATCVTRFCSLIAGSPDVVYRSPDDCDCHLPLRHPGAVGPPYTAAIDLQRGKTLCVYMAVRAEPI